MKNRKHEDNIDIYSYVLIFVVVITFIATNERINETNKMVCKLYLEMDNKTLLQENLDFCKYKIPEEELYNKIIENNKEVNTCQH